MITITQTQAEILAVLSIKPAGLSMPPPEGLERPVNVLLEAGLVEERGQMLVITAKGSQHANPAALPPEITFPESSQPAL